MTITLTYGQFLKVAAWVASGKQVNAYKMFTVEGYAATRNKEDPAEEYARCKANGHETAGAINSGTALVGGDGRFAYYAARDKELADATELTDGQEITAEGRAYRVKLVGPGYSDPIHFIEL